jgi:DNA polymerase III subunit delta'
VPGFDEIIGQARPIRILTHLLRRGTFPHAFLFTGIPGVGKRTAAVAFAMSCNCTGEAPLPEHPQAAFPVSPCGRCRACTRIVSGTHPDLIRIEPSGDLIRISQIRDLCEILTLKPFEARIRVVILSGAQTINPEAGNALLKVLEEPPDRTVLILTAGESQDLLPTIVSRCQQIRFNPIPPKRIEAFLTEKQGIGAGPAKTIARRANGSISRAVSMAGDKWMRRHDWLLRELGTLSERRMARIFAFAEKLSRNKDLLSDDLETIQIWLRDLLVWKYRPDRIVCREIEERIGKASASVSPEALLSAMEAVLAARRNLAANANARLTLERLMLALSGCVHRPNPIEMRREG